MLYESDLLLQAGLLAALEQRRGVLVVELLQHLLCRLYVCIYIYIYIYKQ